MITCSHGHLAQGDLIEGDDPFDHELACEAHLDILMANQVDFMNQRALRTNAGYVDRLDQRGFHAF